MNFSKIMISVGSVIVAFGILFTAQSLSVAGPTSSFMYRNPVWTVNGGVIVAVGVAIIVAGIMFGLKRKNKL